MKCSLAAITLHLIVVLFVSCHHKQGVPIISFYHWTSGETNDDYNTPDCLQHFHTKELYIKVLDVDWDEMYGAYPVTSYKFDNLSYISDSINFIPVVFITNRTLEKTKNAEIQDLAQKIVLKTKSLIRKSSYHVQSKNDSFYLYKQLQLDCDWSATTKQKYFSLLAECKKLLPDKKITTTLRLHQFKYPKQTGIPPADEVYLMCYNTGEVKDILEQNSIYDSTKASDYFKHTKLYPIKMNFALPSFDWVVIYKNGGFYKIDNAFDPYLFKDTSFIKHTSINLYEVQRDTVINNAFIRTGDILKWEKVSDQAMLNAARNCASAVNSDSFSVVFYDLSHIKPDKYETIQKAFDTFRN